jgi:hypothetical protein
MTTEGAETGVATGSSELELQVSSPEFPAGAERAFDFTVLDAEGAPLTDYDVEHAKEMHLIVVRNDLTGFQHLHPEMAADGTWSTPLTLDEAGTYRVFADFSTGGESETLTADVTVSGGAVAVPLPPESNRATAGDGYAVELAAGAAQAGSESELGFSVTRDGEPVEVEPYLGADGHLVALRQDDLAYLHVHPVTDDGHGSSGGHGGSAEAIRFMTEFPTAGNYRLFLQFRDEGEVRTAEFTRAIAG